jgi:hypothetical protein
MTDENCCRASARDAAIASQMGFTDFPVPLLPKPEDPLFMQRQGICLSIQEARRIFEVLPPPTQTIALFTTPDENLILRACDEVEPTMVQPCWDIDAMSREHEARLCERLRPVKIMKAIPIPRVSKPESNRGPEPGQSALETALETALYY